LRISSVFSLYGGGHEGPNSGEIKFANSDFIRNVYKRPQTRHFIHYTSVQSLFEILNSKSLRLYDLNNLNDPKEISYAISSLSDNIEEYLPEYRRSFFCASFCKYSMTSPNDNFLHWRIYGGEGKGVGIVFEITNMEDDWHNVFFGKVNYGLENRKFDLLFKFQQFHFEFNKQHNLFHNVPSAFALMAMYFKHPLWKDEKEYRLFIYANYSPYFLNVKTFDVENSRLANHHLHFTLNKQNKRVGYITMPIHYRTELPDAEKQLENKELALRLTNSVPNLKIVRIVCGHSVPKDVLFELDILLPKYFEKHIGNSVQIGYTRHFEVLNDSSL
jgi:hypothetical protein